MKTTPIYLDYMASTPLAPDVMQAMLPFLEDPFWCANPASIHHWMGQEALRVVELSREKIASVIGAMPEEIIFTSGATESNNLALFGAARFYKRQGKHIITLSTEHKAVLNVVEELAKEGFEVTILDPEPNGLLDLKKLEQAIRADTILVSIMQVNNEIGVIQDIGAIGKLLKTKGILFHVDAAQSYGRLPLNLRELPVDLMSFSGHKVYGPKGIGVLFSRKKPKINLSPLFYGGGQEQGLRPGTLPTAQIAGMAQAFDMALPLRESEEKRLLPFRDELREQIDKIGGIHWNGDWTKRVVSNLNFSIEGVDGSDLIQNLYPLIVSSQSACSASQGSSSHVLAAIGVPNELARASLRISLGRMTNRSDIEQTCVILRERISLLRQQ